MPYFSRSLCVTAALVAIAGLPAIAGAQSPRRVNEAASPGGDGLTWATAYKDLQDALTEARSNPGAVSEIWVAAGTYYPAPIGGSRAAAFEMVNGVSIYGGFAGNETSRSQRAPHVNITVLSGDIERDDTPGEWYQSPNTNGHPERSTNSHHVVIAGVDIVDPLHIDGVTIMRGDTQLLVNTSVRTSGAGVWTQSSELIFTDVVFTDNHAMDLGGAVFCDGSATQFVDCEFTINTATNGGAIGAFESDSTLVLTDCDFSNNVGVGPLGSDPGGHGGAVYTEQVLLVSITGCVFCGNSAGSGGGAYISEGLADFSGCDFVGNSAALGNAGACGYFTAGGTVYDCDFDSNWSLHGGGAVLLGGFSGGPGFQVQSSYFLDNTTGLVGQSMQWGFGAGIYIPSVTDEATIEDCTFTRNFAIGNGGAIAGAPKKVSGTLFEANTAGLSGGAIWEGYADSDQTMYVRSDFRNNFCNFYTKDNSPSEWALNGGGAIWVGPKFVSQRALIANCSFGYNSCLTTVPPPAPPNEASVGGAGGAVRCEGAATFANCVFGYNACERDGGAVSASASVLMRNCTVAYCEAVGAGGGYSGGGVLSNSIFWANTDDGLIPGTSQISGSSGTSVSYCCVEGGYTGGTAVVTGDPLFRHVGTPTTTFNFRLRYGSSCLDTGSNGLVGDDFADLDGDSNTAEALPLDTEATPTPRIRNGTVNIGAYETWNCRADLDDSGSLDGNDYIAWMNYNAAQDLRGDFDNDGDVDVNDYVLFNNAWQAGC